MSKSKTNPSHPALVVICGDDDGQRLAALPRVLDEFLPPNIDRSLALTEYDGLRGEDSGGPSYAGVMDDLQTLPFLSPLRVVVIRDADRFVSAHRDKLDEYFKKPLATGTLVLVLRSLPKTTRLYKSAASIGRVFECKRLNRQECIGRLLADAAAEGKKLAPGVAERLLEQIGPEYGLLKNELEKLCLYAGTRTAITMEDIDLLVGLSREEKVFAAMDAAAEGQFPHAVELWRQVLASDPAAEFKAVGGIAFKLRAWIQAQNMLAGGMPISTVAPKVMMWGRERVLQGLLQRQSGPRLRRLLAALAELDAQAKVGARTIERGAESVMMALAGGG